MWKLRGCDGDLVGIQEEVGELGGAIGGRDIGGERAEREQAMIGFA